MSQAYFIALSGALAVLIVAPARAQAPPPAGQQVVLPETSPLSLRKSRLGATPSAAEILRTDLDRDGAPDILEVWWNGKRARWFDENDDMRPTDTRGDMVMDSVQIDRDGDGFYDGPGDMNVKWADVDKDGDPDLQAVAMPPSAAQRNLWGGESHWMVFVDTDDDNVNGYINWEKFTFENWRTTGKGNFSPDYNGDAIFLKVHLPPDSLNDARLNWENPFAFYDTDNDGVTEMAIRIIDDPVLNPGGEKSGWTLDGKVEETFVTYDLDNDTGHKNEMDFDLTLRFESRTEATKWDYRRYVNDADGLQAPAWVLPYYRFTSWRTIDELVYPSHATLYNEVFRHKYASAYLTFDEDDDDHRWERVEIYYPSEDVYSVSRWDAGRKGGIMGHPQSDTLGDRGEWDMDFSGKGRLYVGRWDGKLHLNGAETGAWLVDYGAKYWGSHPVVGDSSPEKATKVEEVVHYRDTDNNGFFDEITYDYDGDRTVDLKVNLLEFADATDPRPDVAPLIQPGREQWKGMHATFQRIARTSFQDALKIYRAAWKKGLTSTEIDDLAIASSTHEQYDHGYWVREKVFRALDAKLASDPADRREMHKCYFLGRSDALVDFINARAW